MRHGYAVWPGVVSFKSLTYTVSHGVSPATAVYTMLPQATLPDLFGDLVLTDEVNAVKVPGCKIDAINAVHDGRGVVWVLRILDRRWKWRDLGVIKGAYNQRDPRNRLIPWTVKTPTELMELCLKAMGEKRWKIVLPPGGLDFVGPGDPGPGTRPVQGYYPAVNWKHDNPAMALQSLAEQLGCRVIYRLEDDSVLVAPKGEGADLPDGGDISIKREGPLIDSPETPEVIVCVGQPVRRQVRLLLEAVGEEYDGTVRPINNLSYAPDLSPQYQISRVYPNLVTVGNVFTLTVNGIAVPYTATAATLSNVSAGLTAAFNARTEDELANIAATDVGTYVEVHGNPVGEPFDVETSAAVGAGSGAPELTWELIRQADDGTSERWARCVPPQFNGAKATDRLTKAQAEDLARKSVFRWYRVLNADPADGEKGIVLPGYDGRIDRIQQIVLQDTQVEQVVPQPADDKLRDRFGDPFARDFYNGWSRDKPAKVYGSHWRHARGLIALSGQLAGQNSAADGEVFVGFSVDQEFYTIKFEDYVWFQDGDRYKRPFLTLQTSVLVRDADTNQVEHYERRYTFPKGNPDAPPARVFVEDITAGLIAVYESEKPVGGPHPNNTITKAITDGRQADAVADYRLKREAATYVLVSAGERHYNGILPIYLDGAIQQVTWEIAGGEGCFTTASRNNEHSFWIPPYPQRRYAEYLAPAERAARDRLVNPPNPGANMAKGE